MARALGWDHRFSVVCLPHEFRDGLHVVGIAELIDGRNSSEFVTAADQDLRIAGERCRIARYSDHNRHHALASSAPALRPLARRIEHDGVEDLSSFAANGRRKRSRVWASIGLSPDVVEAARCSALIIVESLSAALTRAIGKPQGESADACKQVGDLSGLPIIQHQSR